MNSQRHKVDKSGATRALITALLLVSFAGAASAEVVNRILATLDGEPVTLYELKKFSTSGPIAAQLGQQDPAALLDGLITSRLISLEVRNKGIVIGDREIDNYITQIRQQNQISEEQLYAALEEQGLTKESYRSQIKDELERAQLINREIRGKVSITPEDVERYYQANLDSYGLEPEVTVSHIMLRLADDAPPEEEQAVKARADEIHAMLDRGDDFAAVARQYSEDAAAEDGGALGTFRIGTMLDAMNEAVRDLEVGDYSDPVRSSVGIHIVRLDNRTEATQTPVEEVSEEIRERLYAEALEERYARWLTEDLRKRHHVELLE